jgi:hypothetical protein
METYLLKSLGKTFTINIEYCKYIDVKLNNVPGWFLINNELYEIHKDVDLLLHSDNWKDKLYPENNKIYKFIRVPDGWDILFSKDITQSQKIYNYKTYLIYDGVTKLYKIGKSISPKKRFNQIKTSNPNAILFAICDQDIENILHNEYCKLIVSGEWYMLKDKELKCIFNKYNFKCI